jgi:hypothetical protein
MTINELIGVLILIILLLLHVSKVKLAKTTKETNSSANKNIHIRSLKSTPCSFNPYRHFTDAFTSAASSAMGASNIITSASNYSLDNSMSKQNETREFIERLNNFRTKRSPPLESIKNNSYKILHQTDHVRLFSVDSDIYF